MYVALVYTNMFDGINMNDWMNECTKCENSILALRKTEN